MNLRLILILFERLGLDDVRKGIQSYEKDINKNIDIHSDVQRLVFCGIPSG